MEFEADQDMQMSVVYVTMILLTTVFKMSVAYGVDQVLLMAIVIATETLRMSVVFVVDQE